VVPRRFHRKATASRRNTSTPLLARSRIVSTNGQEDLRVLPVQVPLVFVEGGPDPFAEVGIVGEGAGGLVGEDVDQVLSNSFGRRSLSNIR
jgi:hypothetical protein